jgi:hypothetical protein
MLVVGGAARDDGLSGAEPLMDALNTALRAQVSSGAVSQDEYG